jgi:hypothetical protein
MISYTTSAAWSRLRRQQCGVILSYRSAALNMAQRRGAVLLGHITTVAMFRSGQLGRCCTIESHCSGLHVLQALR